MLSKQHQILGRNINRLRNERGLTLDELGYRSGIDPSHLGYAERGEANLTVAKIFGIAKALKVKASDLFNKI